MTREQAINIAVGCVMAAGVDSKTKAQVIEALREKDVLTRHKWPDEKPKEDKEYLVLYKFTFFNKTFDKMIYHSGEWEVVDGGIHFDVDDEDILYWWELPEVKE